MNHSAELRGKKDLKEGLKWKITTFVEADGKIKCTTSISTVNLHVQLNVEVRLYSGKYIYVLDIVVVHI